MNDSTISQPFFLTSWLMTFKDACVRSITDLNYYVEVLNFSLKFSFKVLACFYLLLGLLLTGFFIFKDLPELHRMINDVRSEAVASYPDTLVFDWNGEELSSTLQQQFDVPFPKAMTPQENLPKNFLVIDTTHDQLPDKLSTLFFVNKKKLYFNSLQGDWADSELSNIIEEDSIHLDKPAFLKIAEASKTTQSEFLSILPWLLLLSNSFGLFFIRLLSIALNALIMQLFFQFLNKPLTYKKVFQLCLHILIPTEIIHQISSFLFPSLVFPMFGLAFWLIVALVLWHLRHLRVVNFQLPPAQNKE